ncbi:ABC transporter ATP-binding protein [Oceanirhabdus sp. W0125-5]|uniref:ABC transporter ATP-binding protein n=1 Tax=Oceanirhabdus sp. W0125-5 TaxID=2999116 RepID=UPI0022F2BA8D|nr:ABC transporter ATP-binding protein [Oceanirhabdus sp. W0125-5]WBW95612.1 ABC transporter ATP-binding protein [Oceanirhabdus sp. W0125-5]
MSVVLRTQDLCKTFKLGSDEVHALKSVNIEIHEGQLTILKGRSGSGKTTLINLLAAMDDPTSGKIFLRNEDISKYSSYEKDKLRRKKIGLCFQSGGLISTLTAQENIELGLRIADYPKKTREQRIKECLDLVGLSKRSAQFPYELSGGEAQRIAIARTIACNPEIIFMDEPTSALDTTTALKIVKVLKELVEKNNSTIVMTTHDPNMIDIADRVYELSDGVIING